MGQSPRELDPLRSARDFFGAELRRRRCARGLSQSELGRLTHHSGHTIGKVEKAQRSASEALARGCDDVLQADGALTHLWGLLAAEARSGHEPSLRPTVSTDLIVETADECVDDVTLYSSYLGPEAIEELQRRTVSLARAYATTPTMECFIAARQIRDLARRLRDQTRRTSQLTDLYLVISQTNALLSSLAFDLGRLDAAATLARGAAVHGEAAGHGSAYAWAEGMLALIANWQGDPSQALIHTDRALARTAPGSARFRVHHIAARAHGLQKDAAAVAASLSKAEADRETGNGRHDDLHDGIGGEFAFGQARAFACAAAAWLDAGDGARATAHAESAVEFFRTVPAAEESTSQLGGVSVDLAAARLLDGDVVEAGAHLHAALAMMPDQLGTAVTGRLQRVRIMLSGRVWRDDLTARRLLAAIAETDQLTG